MEIEKLYRCIILEEMSKEHILKIYGDCLDEKIQQRVQRMISGIESIEMNNGLIINGYHPMSRDEVVYNKYKNIDVPVEGYLVYDLIGHTGEYCIQHKENLIEVEQEIFGPVGLNNMFTAELLILADGKIKRYCVTNQEGIVITKTQIECMSSKEIYNLKVIWKNE